MTDDVLREAADLAGIEFAGSTKELPPPVTSRDKLGNLSLIWEPEGIQAQVNNLTRLRGDIHCLISFRQREGQRWRWLYAPSRINLMSVTAKEKLESVLGKRRSLNWKDRIDQIVIAAGNSLQADRKPTVLKRRTENTEREWIAYPLIEAYEHSMFFAAGGTGKSLIALGLCASLVTGAEFIPGVQISKFEKNTLYLDWETNEKTHEIRLTQLCDGRGVEFPDDRVHYIHMDGPLSQELEFLHEYVIENNIGFVVIDSVGVAAGGNINSDEVAIPYVASVRMLGVTALSIHHVGWLEQDRPTGSRYFWNGPRSQWLVKGEQVKGEGITYLGMFHKKANNGMFERDIGLRAEFNNNAIRYYKQDLQATQFSTDTDPKDQLCEVLSSGRLKLSALYEELPNIPKATIRQTLKRGLGTLFTKFGSGRDVEYGLLAPDDGPVTSVTRHSDSHGRGSVTNPVSKTQRVDVTDRATPDLGDKAEKETASRKWWEE